MVGSSPKLHAIDMSRDADKDRFAMPKASLHFSKAGTQFLGVLDKPSLKVVRWNFEAAKAAENERVDARMHSTPTGRRHDVYYMYLSNTRAEERANGHGAAWERAAERCRRTHRPAHLATSTDNFLKWKCDTRPSTPPAANRTVHTEEARPSTAPAMTSRSPTSWDMWNQNFQVASTPRFQARAAFEYKRCTTPDMDDIKKQTYAKIAAQRSAERGFKQEKEARLVDEWPHGLPTAAKKQAGEAGLKPMGLNFGFPLSLPDRQYEALKTGMKWY